MLMLSSMIDYSSTMEDAVVTKLNMIVFFCFVVAVVVDFFK